MAFPPRLAIGTRNPGKVRELLRICSTWPVDWLTYETAPWPDIEETGETYLDNANLKALGVAATLGIPAVADDSGIEVDALDGAPGPYSAMFAGDGASDRDNLELLIERVRHVPGPERTARYRCVAVCGWPDGSTLTAEATCEGYLIVEPRGTGGFGYDPIFVPDALDGVRTMAELQAAEKDLISHRGKAFRELARRLLRTP